MFFIRRELDGAYYAKRRYISGTGKIRFAYFESRFRNAKGFKTSEDTAKILAFLGREYSEHRFSVVERKFVRPPDAKMVAAGGEG